MRTSCLVNNYNYERFVVQAVESAVRQTVPFDEILVVDDGSTDDSVRRLRQHFAGQPLVRVIEQKNQGQLASFNTGFAASTGDLITFLDADDEYEPDYLAALLNVYTTRPYVDFAYCQPRPSGTGEPVATPDCQDRDIGCTLLQTYLKERYYGTPTSCLSARRRLLDRFLPLPLLEDWRICADTCLVQAASLVGAWKYELSRPLVHYRLHGENNFHNRQLGQQDRLQHRVIVNRLFAHVLQSQPLDVGRIIPHMDLEFLATGEVLTFRRLWRYLRLANSADVAIGCKFRMMRRLIKAYLRYQGAKNEPPGRLSQIWWRGPVGVSGERYPSPAVCKMQPLSHPATSRPAA